MDSRFWSESLPEPSGEWQVVLGLPESFRAAQNTTCYVRLNMNLPIVKLCLTLQPHSSASESPRSRIRSVVGAKLWQFILL